MGNIPMDLTEGLIIQFFRDEGLPIPWKALTRAGASGRHQYCIATFETIKAARDVLGRRIKWPDGKHAILRLDFANMLYDHPVVRALT